MSSENRTPLTEAQRDCVAANMPLVYWFARQWVGRIRDWDGYISNLQLKLCYAVRSHDPERGALSTYAVTAFARCTFDVITTQARRSRRIVSLTPMLRDRDSACGYSPLAVDAEQGQSVEAECVEIYRNLRDRLTRRDRAVVRWRGNGETLETIGCRQGISRERVRQIAKRVVRTLREAAAGMPNRKSGRPAKAPKPPRPAKPAKAPKLTPERTGKQLDKDAGKRSRAQHRYLQRRAMGLCVTGCGSRKHGGLVICKSCQEKAKARRATG